MDWSRKSGVGELLKEAPHLDKSRESSLGSSPTLAPAPSAAGRPPGSALRSAQPLLRAAFCAAPAGLVGGESAGGGRGDRGGGGGGG